MKAMNTGDLMRGEARSNTGEKVETEPLPIAGSCVPVAHP